MPVASYLPWGNLAVFSRKLSGVMQSFLDFFFVFASFSMRSTNRSFFRELASDATDRCAYVTTLLKILANLMQLTFSRCTTHYLDGTFLITVGASNVIY